ncbi:MAG: hypothetical protein JXX28_09630 [Deltaproteobacteria bacterium]|nr:hypothetical protein [Deltaproteobacteria bacterium]
MRHLLFALPLLAACGASDPRLVDDVDTDWDFLSALLLGEGSEDALHGPYVQGASFSVWVFPPQDQGTHLEGYQVRSEDLSVMSIEAQTYQLAGDDTSDAIHVELRAAEAGTTDLILVDSEGAEVRRVTVEVGFPDRLELFAAGPLFASLGDQSAPAPQVLVGGTGTFQVRYYQGDTLLSGNGTLTVDATEDLQAGVAQSFLFEDREWLQVSPLAAGQHGVALYVDGVAAGQVDVDAVDVDAVARVELLSAEPAEEAQEGDPGVVLAQAFDADDAPIYGLDYDWTLGGVTQDGQGDLFRYTVDPDATTDLVASFGDLSDSGSIDGVEGYVGSSNETGCSSVGAGLSLWGLLALPWMRRRRAA